MGSLSDIVTISISAQTAAAKQAGFGVPLIAGAASRFAEVVRTYTDLDGVADDFLTTDAEYLAAVALCAQNPRPPSFKIGRRALPPTIVARITPTAVNSMVYRVVLDGENASYTSDSSASAAEITAGLKTAIDTLSPSAWVKKTSYALGDECKKSSGRKYTCITAGTSQDSDSPTFAGTEETADVTDGTAHWKFTGVVPTVADGGSYITATSPVAGGYFSLAIDDDPATVGYAGLSIEYTHADPGIATDLAAIAAADPDWYAFCLTTCGSAEVKAAAAWAESNSRLMVQASPETSDIAVVLASATDVPTTLKAATDSRSSIWYHRIPSEFLDAALLGARLWTVAGSEDWMFVQLSGITADKLSATHITNLKAKNCNFYTLYGGFNITVDGKCPSGVFIDFVRGRDALHSDMQSSIYAARVRMAATGKTPFTDAGLAAIEGEIRASLERFERKGFLAKGSSNVSSVTVSDVADSDRSARRATGFVWTATTAGSVHSITISGTVSV